MGRLNCKIFQVAGKKLISIQIYLPVQEKKTDESFFCKANRFLTKVFTNIAIKEQYVRNRSDRFLVESVEKLVWQPGI